MRQRFYLVAGIVLLLVIALLVGYFSLALRLVKAEPKDGARNVSLDRVELTFNQEMGSATVNATDAEAVNVFSITPWLPGVVEVSDRSIIFTPLERFGAGQTYSVSLRNVRSKNGRGSRDIAIQFSTAPVLASASWAALIKSLPYETSGFVVDYQSATGKIQIRIYEDPVEEQKQKAFEYIRLFGVDPDKEPVDIYLAPGVTGGGSGP